MSRLLLVLGLAALAGACGKPSPSAAGSCSPGPEGFSACSEQGLICDLSGRCTPPRYEVNGDGTVTDAVTELVWQQILPSNPCPSDADGGMGCFWPDAQAYCQALSLGTFPSGWRVPTVPELFSLGDPSADAGVESAVFPTIGSNILWTSDTVGGLNGDAWSVTFVPYNDGMGGGPDVIAQTYTSSSEVNDTLEWVLCVH